jgi:serine/threonine-protein kinase
MADAEKLSDPLLDPKDEESGEEEQEEKDPFIGAILDDRYEILEMVGKGGMGSVYKARHTVLDRIVAIKVLHENLINSPTTLLRFQQESKAVASLNHPNIMIVHDCGVVDKKPYLVVEYLEGKTLDDVLKEEGHLAVERCNNIIKQACDALQHAHDKNIVHRDIKPSNLMLVKTGTEEDFVKLVDFGIAKFISDGNKETMHLTQTGDIFGSPLYMSPEQCRGKHIDWRSDIYSLGCVVYRALSGKPPFYADDLPECLYKHVTETPLSFSTTCPELGVPDDEEKIVFKAVAIDPKDRYQSMLAFKQDIEAFEGGQEVSAPVPVIKTGYTDPGLANAPGAGSPPVTQRPATQPPAIAPGLEVATAANVAPGVSVSVTHPPGTTPPTPSVTFPLSGTSPPGSFEQTAPSNLGAVLAPPAAGKTPLYRNPIAIGGISAVVIALLAGASIYLSQPQPEKIFQGYIKAGNEAFDKKNYALSEQNFGRAMDIGHKFGNNSAEISSASDLLGKTFIAEGKFDKYADLSIQQNKVQQAVGVLTDALAQAKKQAKPDNDKISDIMYQLAALFTKQGNYKLGDSFYTEATNVKSGTNTTAQQQEEKKEEAHKRMEAYKEERLQQQRRAEQSKLANKKQAKPQTKQQAQAKSKQDKSKQAKGPEKKEGKVGKAFGAIGNVMTFGLFRKKDKKPDTTTKSSSH